MPLSPSERPPKTRRLSLQVALVFYGLLAMAAVAWAGLDPDHGGLVFRTPDDRLLPAVGMGVGFAILVIALTGVLQTRSEAMRRLAGELREMLGPIGPGQAALLAFSSGVAEEMFFRGAMQGALGLLPATLVFGLLHGLPGTRHAVWGAFALVVGLVLGLLQIYGGSLLAPTLAHFTINFFNLMRLGREEEPGC